MLRGRYGLQLVRAHEVLVCWYRVSSLRGIRATWIHSRRSTQEIDRHTHRQVHSVHLVIKTGGDSKFLTPPTSKRPVAPPDSNPSASPSASAIQSVIEADLPSPAWRAVVDARDAENGVFILLTTLAGLRMILDCQATTQCAPTSYQVQSRKMEGRVVRGGGGGIG